MDSQIRKKRKYELKRRAEDMADTRQRITDAAIELHGTLGPARTTVSAVAELAGVQRHTVYRHFPTDVDLFASCSAHYMDDNPLPDLDPWRAVPDPHERLHRALDELYAYHERNVAMFSNVLRDAEVDEAVRDTLLPYRRYMAEAVEVLAAGWPGRGRRRRVLEAALSHAIDFHTWRSLTSDGQITRTEVVELAVALVAGVTAKKHEVISTQAGEGSRSRSTR